MRQINAVRGCYAEPQPGFAETNDCGVRALAVAACITYAEAHDICKRAGRRWRKGMCVISMTEATRKAAPGMTHAWNYNIDGRITLSRLLSSGKLDQGIFVLLVPGHYIAVIDGVVHNWGSVSTRKQVLFAWRLA